MAPIQQRRLLPYLPAVLAAVTDVVTAAMIRANQPDYPGRFIVFQIVMLGAALLFATPFRRAWVVAFLLLIAGVLLAAASVGFLYAPTVAAAGWVMVRRLETCTPSFLDTKPQRGVIYTESELEAMRNRQSQQGKEN